MTISATVTHSLPSWFEPLRIWFSLRSWVSSVNQLRRYCASKMVGGVTIEQGASEMLDTREFTLVTEPQEFDLVVLSDHDLGFRHNSTYQLVCERANELGLVLCPPEIGPSLCCLLTRPKKLVVAMKPIPIRGGQRLFTIEFNKDGSRTLGSVGTSWAEWGHVTDGFIFVKPRSHHG